MRKLGRRLYFLWNRRRLDRELAEEMDAHREMMAPERRAGFGNMTRLREESRATWSWTWLEQLCQDLSYGARMLRHAPAFTLGAVAVLALGVGVNLAEFEVFDAVAFHRLHFRDADSLLQFSHLSKQGNRLGFPSGAVEFYRAKSHSFAWLVAEDYQRFLLEGGARLNSDFVSGDYFANIGIVPAWGRLLDARDMAPGAPPVAVLGYEYWQTHWGADPHVVGHFLHVNGHPVEVVGVAPYDFASIPGSGTDAWFPVTLRPLLLPGSPPLQEDFSSESQALFGKLRPGVSLAAGDAELTSLTRELAHTRHSFRDDERVEADFVQASLARKFERSPAIAILLIMILLVLLSACANLGNMLLARGLGREREIRIRTAIGASRARVVRQLMTENFLLAVLGSAAGLAFGAIAGRLLLIALDAPLWVHLSITWPIVAAAFALTLLSALAFGLPSALQTVRPKPNKIRLRQGLIGAQVAVSCLLLIASGVLAHNGIASASLEMPFDYRNMIVIYPQLYAHNLTAAVAQQNLGALSDRLAELPGVAGITVAVSPPLGGRRTIDSLPGLPPIYRNVVEPSYFRVMNLPILRGRSFVPEDQNTAIVSESAARAIWPNREPLGQSLNLLGSNRTVVGVAKDSGANLLVNADSVEVYLPIQPDAADKAALIVHSHGDPAALVRLISSSMAEVKESAIVVLMRTSRDDFLDTQRKMITLIGFIGLVATVLAAAGMFALVAFTVAQRKREIGIRMALGAVARNILGVLLGQNARPMAIGVAAGAILAALLSHLVQSIVVLQNHGPVDALGFTAGIAAFVLVAVLATLSPALRALRIDPATTLREE